MESTTITRFLRVLPSAPYISAWLALCVFGPSLAMEPRQCSGAHWVVESYKFENVSAADEVFAAPFVGKSVNVSAREMRFGSLRCVIEDKSISASNDEPGYGNRMHFKCSDGVVVPTVYFNQVCSDAIAVLDGVTFYLRAK